MAAGQSWDNILEGNMYLIKLDPNDNKEWDKTIGGGLEDGAYDIQQTPDRGYIVAGYTRSTTDGSYKVYIVKTDSDGNVEWSKDFGGGSDDQAFSLEQHRDGYVVAGFTKSHGESSDVYVLRVDLDGNLVWEKTFGGRDTEEVAQSIYRTSDGGYILAGKNNQYTYGSYDVYLLKLDSDGNEQWSQVFGGENDEHQSNDDRCEKTDAEKNFQHSDHRLELHSRESHESEGHESNGDEGDTEPLKPVRHIAVLELLAAARQQDDGPRPADARTDTADHALAEIVVAIHHEQCAAENGGSQFNPRPDITHRASGEHGPGRDADESMDGIPASVDPRGLVGKELDAVHEASRAHNQRVSKYLHILRQSQVAATAHPAEHE